MLPKRRLGKAGPQVGCIGYGAMVLEGYYGPSDDDQSVETIRSALDAGMNMLDSADAYGNGHNEELIGRAIANRREHAFVCTKFGIVFDESEPATEVPTGWGFSLHINGKPAYVRKALDASLRRLHTDVIDLWYAHYPDPSTPIEDTVDAMAEGVAAGKVRYLGLSNVTADQVRRAHSVHPVAAVQYEYSLWRREIETTLLPTLNELGIALVPWSPLGGGFLTGTVTQLEKDDFRQNNPKYAGEGLTANLDRFAPLLDLARQLGATPSQLALAWLLHQGEAIVPIPGTRRPERIDENAKAADLALDSDTLIQIDRLAPVGLAEGATLL
ncbi:MAG: aldo/keto reductase [Deltaproteobacteria bacterium SG8_13]|nr:MAG: aldo/keto reductase [Deltaproteobacteria bacterium SG8_13]